MFDRAIKVLLIDQNPMDTRQIMERLSQAGDEQFDLETADSLSTALSRLNGDPVDLIVLDLLLPDSGGFDTFAKIFNYAPNVPVIVLTGKDNESEAVKALWTGAQDYLIKDKVDCEQVARTIRYAIDRHRATLAQQQIDRKHQTERNALEEVWRRYEFIVNTSREFMTLVSREYRYEAANESYCKAHNKSRDEIVGKTVEEVWGTGRYLAKIKEPFDKCFADNETHFEGWLSFSALGTRYMDVTYYPYYGPTGDVTHAVVVSRDITERKLAEEAFQQAHAQNQQLLIAIPSILIGVSPDDLITHWNAPAEVAFDIAADTVIGKPFAGCGIQWAWESILSGISSSRQAMQPGQMTDVKYLRADGKERFLEITVSPYAGQDGSQSGFLLVGVDVTERKVLESQLGNAQKLESIGQLAAGIAHEINTPTQYVGDNIKFFQESFEDVTTLLTKYDSLLKAAKNGGVPPELISEIEATIEEVDLPFLSEEIPVAITQSLQGIDHVSGIVRAMKEFSHPGVEEKTAIDINQTIESTITVARNEWKYIADVETDFAADMPLVPCLPGEFNQVVLNMIINATHAIADVVRNSPDEKGLITISTRRDGDWVEVRVRDTGTGIPDDVKSRIFDPFFTTKEVGRGTGQGLAISHAVITEKHNGTITLETKVGQGTTFIIRLPLDNAARNGDL